MRVLAATNTSQGDRTTDFSDCVDGELVFIPETCDYDGSDRRRCQCGCAISFAGLSSRMHTTTATIVDLDLSRGDYVDMLREGLEHAGWPVEWAESDADELLSLAERWPVGDVLERSMLSLGRRFNPVTGQLLAPLAARHRR